MVVAAAQKWMPAKRMGQGAAVAHPSGWLGLCAETQMLHRSKLLRSWQALPVAIRCWVTGAHRHIYHHDSKIMVQPGEASVGQGYTAFIRAAAGSRHFLWKGHLFTIANSVLCSRFLDHENLQSRIKGPRIFAIVNKGATKIVINSIRTIKFTIYRILVARKLS